jgi:hypothetical protein
MKTIIVSAVLAVTFLVLGAGRAEAAKIPFIYQSGEDIFDCGPLPAPYTGEKTPDGKELRAGYICDITGVFFTYFSVKNCRPVAYSGDATYMPDEGSAERKELEALLAKTYPESSMKRGFWNKFGWMIMAGLVVLGIVFAIKDKFSAKPTDAAT